MIEQSFLLKLSTPGIADSTTSRLRQQYQAYQRLFQAQPVLLQQYMGVQAASLAEAVIKGFSQVHFTLPDVVAVLPMSEGSLEDESVLKSYREQRVGRGLGRLTPLNLTTALGQHLEELERSENQGVSISAMLLRIALAVHMVYNMLPAGRSVKYKSAEGDDIPNQPIDDDIALGSTINSTTDMQNVMNQVDKVRGELFVPYVEAARRFYLPQWVAFDDHGKLLLGSLSEAEAQIISMQNYLTILNSAIVIAPFMIADETWQQKRYGMLGQLVNQGRALAYYQSQEIIQTIKSRVDQHKLDRGLRLSLPYFDDQTMLIENHTFIVIPVGRIMFIPAFAVLAAREQQIMIAENTHLSLTTRKHLLAELHEFEFAFIK